MEGITADYTNNDVRGELSVTAVSRTNRAALESVASGISDHLMHGPSRSTPNNAVCCLTILLAAILSV